MSATGIGGTFKAEVIVTMNFTNKVVNGTNAITHDDYEKLVPVHKIETIINGEGFAVDNELLSESAVLKKSEEFICRAQERITHLANTPPQETFLGKMQQLFS